MAGIFDLKTGAFDSSEAHSLYEAYEIALQGLKSTRSVDRALQHRLARSIVKVVRAEPDCLKNDGTIDPVRLAQRAILRMLQTSAPALAIEVEARTGTENPRSRLNAKGGAADPNAGPVNPPQSVAKIMLKLFERTPFAKL